jgi:hypothetical protein
MNLPSRLHAVGPPTPDETEEAFDNGAMEAPLSQAKALRKWPQLVEGAFYQHHKGHFVRRITEIIGQDVYWTDQIGPGRCSQTCFRQAVSGPLGREPTSESEAMAEN